MCSYFQFLVFYLLGTGRRPGGSLEHSDGQSYTQTLEIMYPPFDLEVPRDPEGGGYMSSRFLNRIVHLHFSRIRPVTFKIVQLFEKRAKIVHQTSLKLPRSEAANKLVSLSVWTLPAHSSVGWNSRKAPSLQGGRILWNDYADSPAPRKGPRQEL